MSAASTKPWTCYGEDIAAEKHLIEKHLHKATKLLHSNELDAEEKKILKAWLRKLILKYRRMEKNCKKKSKCCKNMPFLAY